MAFALIWHGRKFTTALLSFYDSGINRGWGRASRQLVSVPQISAWALCTSCLCWGGKKNLWFVHCSSGVSANSKKFAYFSLGRFSKSWEIEMAPCVRRVVRERGWKALSRWGPRLLVHHLWEELPPCGGCIWHPNFLKKWRGFNSMTAFVKENGYLSNFLPTYLTWSCLSRHVCIFLYTSCPPIHLWRKYLRSISVLC